MDLVVDIISGVLLKKFVDFDPFRNEGKVIILDILNDSKGKMVPSLSTNFKLTTLIQLAIRIVNGKENRPTPKEKG